MELHHLRYFTKLAETLHFTQAAEELFITQPALSQQIRQLEGELGIQLFERIGKKIKLTDAGSIFLEYARGAIKEVLKGEQAMSDLKNEVSGNVRIGVMYSYFDPLLSVMADFCKHYPGVRVHLQYGNNEEILEQLLQSDLDIALMFDNNPSDDLEIKGEFTAHLKVAVAKNHPFASLPIVSLLQLKNTLVALPVPGNIIRAMVEDGFKKYKVWPFINSELNDIHLLLDLIEKGDFATIVTDTAIFKRDNIVLLPIEEELPITRAVVLVKKNIYLSKAANLFLENILQKLQMLSTDRT